MSESAAKKAGKERSPEETIIQMVDARAALYGDRTIMQNKQDGSWIDVTWSRLAAAYKDVARGLIQLGLEQDDSIAILSENRPEWVFADLGIYASEVGGKRWNVFTSLSGDHDAPAAGAAEDEATLT